MKKTVKEYCKDLIWSISDLQRAAGISYDAASNAFYGRVIQPRTRRDVCKALTTALHESIQETDIDWKGES